jgi:hypothetical protein
MKYFILAEIDLPQCDASKELVERINQVLVNVIQLSVVGLDYSTVITFDKLLLGKDLVAAIDAEEVRWNTSTIPY